jgi:hypothetical protein
MADNDNNLVFTVSSDMSAAQRGLAKFAVDVGASADQIARKYQTAGNKIDGSVSALQTRINGMVGIGAKVSKEWTGALADQGKELERLRARYSPLFATINTYKTAVSEIQRAHAIGAISANEMATAISKERQAALASTAAIKGRNAALAVAPTQRNSGGVGAFQTANITAQFQDIAVTSAMGMSPLQIALQQGTQLSSVIGTLGNGKGVVTGLAAAFGSLLSPVSLVTIALVAGSAAAIHYFSSVASGGEQSEEPLKKEAELIQTVASIWGDVLPELKKYADERQKLLDTKEQKDAAAAAANQQWVELRKTVGDVKVAFVDVRSQIEAAGGDAEAINALQKAFNDLTKGIADGTAKAEQAQTVQKALVDLATQTGVPAIAEFAKTFDGLATSVNGVADAAERLKNGPLFNENFAKSKLPTLGTLGPVFSDNGKFITDPNEIDRYMKQQEDNRNPTIDTGRGVPVAVPTPTAKPIQLGEEPDKEIAKAETAATKAANAYRDLVKSASDRIGQVQQEIELLGKFGVEADAARFALDLMQQSEDKGRSLSDAQRSEIQKKVDLYKQYSETLAKAKLAQDLLQQQRFNSLSKEDQQVSTTLRQYGLSDDLGSKEAGQIRQSLRTDELRDDLKSFATDFRTSLLNNGGDIGKAFADSIENALMNQVAKIWDKLFDQIINAFVGSGSGQAAASNGGGIGGAIVSALTGNSAAKSTPAASSTVSATGDIASYIAKAAVARNIDPNVALKVAMSEGGLKSWNLQSNYMKNGVQEPSFGPFQLYKGGGLGNAFMSKTGLDPALAANGPAGVDFALDHASKNGWGAWYGAGKSGIGDMEGINVDVDKFRKSIGGASEAITAQMRSATGASSSLGQVAGSAGTATQGLGSLGTVLNNFGQKLSSGFPDAPGGGGIGSWFSKLFGGGGLNAYGTSVLGSSAQFAGAWNSGGIGLFADGGHVSGEGGPTSDSIPAMLSNGEFVINAASTRKHRRLLEAINSGSVAHLAKGGIVAPSLAPSGGSGGGGVEVNIINNSGAKISKTERKTASGKSLDVVIDDMVADKMNQPGSRSRGAVQSQFGLRTGLAKR